MRILGDEGCAVFLAEDSEDDAKLTVRALRRTGIPMRIVHAVNGQEAIEFLAGDVAPFRLHESPRLALLDMRMPGYGGIDVLEAIRANPIVATMPVVFMTSSDELGETARNSGLAANSFVRKPTEYQDYLDTVSQVARYWLGLNFWPA